MKILFNATNNNLYCIYSKEKIHIGEEYLLVEENYLGEILKKTYKLEYQDCLDEEEIE